MQTYNPNNVIGTNTGNINLSEVKEKFLENILRELSPKLTDTQYNQVKIAVVNELTKVEILDPLRGYDERLREEPEKLLKAFLNAKKLEGVSKRTLKYYEGTLKKVFIYLEYKPVSLITANDIRDYLMYKTSEDGGSVSVVTTNNIRRVCSSFFGWCFNEDYIIKSPMVKIKAFKEPKLVKKEFSDTELEQLRKYLSESLYTNKLGSAAHKGALRDRAIVELLLSSGIRIGELVRLKYGDLDFVNNTTLVFGKGSKERRVFFTDKAKVYLIDYFKQREKNAGEPLKSTDGLFVSINQHKPLGLHGIERRIRDIGNSAGVPNTHPHRFRRTFATRMVRKGMSLEKVQRLMGHEDMRTTMIYVNSSDKGLAYEYDKYVD